MALLMIMSFTGDLITTTMRWSLKKGLSPSHHLCPTSLEALSDFAISPRIRRELDSSQTSPHFFPMHSSFSVIVCLVAVLTRPHQAPQDLSKRFRVSLCLIQSC